MTPDIATQQVYAQRKAWTPPISSVPVHALSNGQTTSPAGNSPIAEQLVLHVKGPLLHGPAPNEMMHRLLVSLANSVSLEERVRVTTGMIASAWSSVFIAIDRQLMSSTLACVAPIMSWLCEAFLCKKPRCGCVPRVAGEDDGLWL